MDWGTVPDWVAALGTTGALVVAVVVLIRELTHRREERVELTKAQAKLVACWLTRPGPVNPGKQGASLMYQARVVNRSDLPVYGCLLRLDWPGEPASYTVLGVIAPGADATREIGVGWSLLSQSSSPNLSMGFVDAAGAVWRKYGNGQLETGTWPVPQTSDE